VEPGGRDLSPQESMVDKTTGQMILVAGPYRSGTADDPVKMAANVHLMEAYALPLFRAGHALAALIFGRFCLGSYLFLLFTGRLGFANRTLPWARAELPRDTWRTRHGR
jgi:hypothetical protein